MAFTNIAGRAGFLLELDKSQLTRGLPEAEREFDTATKGMAASATRSAQSTDAMTQSSDRLGIALGSGSTAGLIGRVGLLTFGINAAYQANQHLQTSLKTTGQEAYTTEGKMRNFASSLLSGDLLGGIEALNAVPKTLDEWGVSLDDAQKSYEAFKNIAESDSPFAKLAQQAVDLVDQTRLAAASIDALNFSLRTTNTLASGAQIPVGSRPDEGTASPGGVAAEQAARAATGGTGDVTTGRPPPRPIGPAARLQAAITIAQANGDLEEVLRLQTIQRDRLAKALENSHGNVKRREQLNQSLAQAEAAVIQTRKQIEANAKAARDAAQAAADARAAEAARRLRAGLSAREQQLRNQYEAALQTPGQRDDQGRFAALRDFLLGESRDKRLDAGERADFRGKLVAVQGERKADLKALADAADQQTRDELAAQEQVLKNRVKAADLTKKNKADDLKALRALRDFYKQNERDRQDVFSDLEQARFGSDRLDTQKKIADLLAGKTSSESAFTLSDLRRMQFEFIQSLNGITNQFGGNLTSGQVATNTWQSAKLTGHLVRSVDRLTRGVAHPGAKYARLELMEPFGSVGSV